ncbi:MAG: preprotein translocase subunit SecA, partial [Patescibacteria group bacterium]
MFLENFFKGSEKRYLKRLETVAGDINVLEPRTAALSDDDLKKETARLKARLSAGAAGEDILPEAFAAVREAARRTLKQRHFDVQLMGGIILHERKIAEMRTGEGKTLVATLSAYLNALSGKGVHVVTVNDYLARRDAVWMGQIYDALGLSVGIINTGNNSFVYDREHTSENQKSIHSAHSTTAQGGEQSRTTSSGLMLSIAEASKIKPVRMDIRPGGDQNLDETRDELGSFKVVHEFLRPCSRKEAYAADITYGTNNEYGFDYLRDNIAYSREEVVQRGFYYAIVDEIDSILIDEARTPLIISAPSHDPESLYYTFARIAASLKEGSDYTVDEKLRAITLSDDGITKAEKILGISNIYTDKGIKYVHHLENAVRAKALFHKDKEYVIRDSHIVIVDEFTGRLQPGRRWSEGLHQAIEAKEGLVVERESRTVASITFQNYFRLYEKLSGMTGTAATSSEEFARVYDLEVVTVPTNKPMKRADHNDLIFQTENGKITAVVRKVKELHEKGQPVLIGTASIEKNELFSAYFEKEGVSHTVLNAKNHEREGEIIAQAGRKGAVTIATNMAGRGVDIILGGNPPDAGAQEEIRKNGGLFVIGTERHDARRIDNQLRGRAGRQGAP